MAGRARPDLLAIGLWRHLPIRYGGGTSEGRRGASPTRWSRAEFGLRVYAGVPTDDVGRLRSRTLCVIDTAEEMAEGVVASASRFAAQTLHDDVAVLVLRVPDDAGNDPMGRVVRAIGLPPDELSLPGCADDGARSGARP